MVVWKDVVGFEGLYKVSSVGIIKRIAANTSTFVGKILKPDIGCYGYHRVTLFKNGKRYRKPVHVIVCTAFHGPKPPKHEVNHIDEIKGHNAAHNLEWKTSQDNKLHSFIRSGKRNYFARKRYIFTDPIGKQYVYTGLREFCSEHGLAAEAMSCVAKGIYSQHKGWKCEELC